MTESTESAVKSFDAGSLEVADDASAEFEVYDPRAKGGTGIFITVLSKDSEKAKTITRSQLNRRFKVMGRSRAGVSLTAEELESESMDLLVACTLSWRGMKWNGEDLACSAQNARDIYTRSPIIRDQVDEAINDRSLFTRR